MESQPQNAEFRVNPENFQCITQVTGPFHQTFLKNNCTLRNSSKIDGY